MFQSSLCDNLLIDAKMDAQDEKKDFEQLTEQERTELAWKEFAAEVACRTHT